jgi:hypothetical protein
MEYPSLQELLVCLVSADELGSRFWDHLYRKQPAAELDEQGTDCGEWRGHAILRREMEARGCDSVLTDQGCHLMAGGDI